MLLSRSFVKSKLTLTIDLYTWPLHYLNMWIICEV